MAKGWLNILDIGARIASPFIRLGVTLGRSLGELGRIFTETGTAIEASSLRRIYEADVEERSIAKEIEGQPPDLAIDPSKLPEAITRQRREYAWKVRVGYIEPGTGERRSRMLTISTDQLLSPNEALAEARGMMEDEYQIKTSFLVSAEMVGVTRAAPGRRL